MFDRFLKAEGAVDTIAALEQHLKGNLERYRKGTSGDSQEAG